MSLDALIQFAYVTFADGNGRAAQSGQVDGLPAWASTARFTINATADPGTPVEQMLGPMLRALLEQRFALKVHREDRPLPGFALEIGKSGVRMRTAAEASCAPPGPDLPSPQAAGRHVCGDYSSVLVDGNYVVNGYAMSLAGICRFLSLVVDRPVSDRTGLTGRFDFHVEFASGGSASGDSIFDAAGEQLGLQLVAEEQRVPVLVIDRVEQPSHD